MHKHVVIDILVRVRRIVHEHEVARIACHEQVAHAVNGTLVQTPTHVVVRSRARKGRIGFIEEIFTQVDKGNNLRLHLMVLDIRLDLHDTGTAKDKDGLRIRVIRTTVSTFQGVNQDGHAHLRDGGIPNRGAVRVAVRCIPDVHLGRIGDITEIGFRSSRFFIAFRADLEVVADAARVALDRLFATTALIAGPRKEGVAFFVPDKR